MKKKIKLSKEAQHALKRIKPSDKRLIEVVNTNEATKSCTDQLARWMAIQILGTYGYEFTTE